MGSQVFDDLGTAIRGWAQLAKRYKADDAAEIAGAEAGGVDYDLLCSESYLELWCSWSDANARAFIVRDSFFDKKQGRQNVHRIEVLFTCMWTSYKLRTDKELKDVSCSSFCLLCPAPVLEWSRENWQALQAAVPSSSTISRNRLANNNNNINNSNILKFFF